MVIFIVISIMLLNLFENAPTRIVFWDSLSLLAVFISFRAQKPFLPCFITRMASPQELSSFLFSAKFQLAKTGPDTQQLHNKYLFTSLRLIFKTTQPLPFEGRCNLESMNKPSENKLCVQV